MTVRCGSSANFWNTIAVLCRRNSRSARLPIWQTSSPPTTTSPTVGSMRRLMWRMRVDFPEPESPMTTWIEPAAIDRLMSLSPSTCPCFSWSSAFVMPPLTASTWLAARGPKIL